MSTEPADQPIRRPRILLVMEFIAILIGVVLVIVYLPGDFGLLLLVVGIPGALMLYHDHKRR